MSPLTSWNIASSCRQYCPKSDLSTPFNRMSRLSSKQLNDIFAVSKVNVYVFHSLLFNSMFYVKHLLQEFERTPGASDFSAHV